MTRSYRLPCALAAAAALLTAIPVSATNAGCAQAMRMQQQGLSVEEIAAAFGMTVGAVHGLCAAPQPVAVPRGYVASGPAGPAPFGAAGPAPMGAAGPAPMGAAGPAPMGAAGPAPMGAAGATSVGTGSTSTQTTR